MKNLLESIQLADVENLEQLIAAGADINKLCSNGEYPLAIAVSCIVRYYPTPANPNYSINYRHFNIIEILLAAGADIEIKNENQQTLLHQLCAIENPDNSIWMNFIKADSKLYLLARELSTKAVVCFIRAGADLNAKDVNGYTPILSALECGNVEIAHSLFLAGCEISNVQTKNGMTLLHCAAVGAKEKSMRILIEEILNQRNLNINALNHRNQTPLDLTRNVDMMCVLLKSGGISTTRNTLEYFRYAFSNQHTELTNYLLNNGVASQIFNNGLTALHMANKREEIEILLQHGANVFLKDKQESMTPLLMWARGCAMYNYPEEALAIINLYATFGAKLDEVDDKGQSLLHYAVLHENLIVIKYLISKGLSVDIQDKEGNTPLHLAISKLHTDGKMLEIVSYLISACKQPYLTNNQQLTALEKLEILPHYSFRESKGLNAVVQAIWPLIQQFNDSSLDPNNNNEQSTHDELNSNNNTAQSLIQTSPVDVLPRNSASLWWLAINSNHSELVEFLLARGIDLHVELGQRPVWHFAVEHGFKDLLNRLLGKGLNLRQRASANGQMAIHVAGHALQVEMVEFLIHLGIEINVNDCLANNILHILFLYLKSHSYISNLPNEEKFNRVLKIFCILENFVDELVVSENKDRDTPFDLLLQANIDELTWPFIHYFIINDVPILQKYFSADRYGHSMHRIGELITLIVQASDTETIQGLLRLYSQDIQLPLALEIMKAANSELFEIILDNGFDLNQPFKYSTELQYPLEYLFLRVNPPPEVSIQNKYEQFACYLIERGAEIHFPTKYMQCAYQALRLGWSKFISLLLHKKLGFSVNSAFYDAYGKNLLSPLYIAVQHNHTLLSQLLIEEQANVNYAIAQGWTPLHLACQNRNLILVKALIAAGANVNAKAKDNHGFYHYDASPLYSAIGNQPGADEIILFLLHHGAQIDAMLFIKAIHAEVSFSNIQLIVDRLTTEEVIMTKSLHTAILKNRLDIVEYLLKLPVAEQLMKMLTQKGETPLHLATLPGRAAIFSALIANGANIDAADYAGYSVAVHAICHQTAINCGIALPPDFDAKEFEKLRVNLMDEQEIVQLAKDQRQSQLALYCYKLHMTFINANKALYYIKKYREASSRQPIHDLCLFNLPTTGNWDKECWGNFAIEHGKDLLAYLHLAPRIEALLKRAPQNLQEIKNIASLIKYNREAESPHLAMLFARYQVPEHAFNRVIDSYKPKLTDNMPPLYVDGSEFNEPRYYFTRLAADDPRGFILGALTHCCQSVGSAGEVCAMHGMTSKNSAFYAVFKRDVNEIKKYTELKQIAEQARTFEKFIELLPFKSQKQKYRDLTNTIIAEEKLNFIRQHLAQQLEECTEGELIAQCWAWLSRSNSLVFDSWERLRAEDDRLCAPFIRQAALQAVSKFNIPQVLLGKGGQTPENLSFNNARELEFPKDYYDYRDSNQQQYLITTKYDYEMNNKSQCHDSSVAPNNNNETNRAQLNNIDVNNNNVTDSANIADSARLPEVPVSEKITLFSPLFSQAKDNMFQLDYEAAQIDRLLDYYLKKQNIIRVDAITDLKQLSNNQVETIKLFCAQQSGSRSCIIPIKKNDGGWSCLIYELHYKAEEQLSLSMYGARSKYIPNVIYLDPAGQEEPHYTVTDFLQTHFQNFNHQHTIRSLKMVYEHHIENSAPWLIHVLAHYEIGRIKIFPAVDLKAIREEHCAILQEQLGNAVKREKVQ